jgi:hypothetical protein
MNRNKAGRKNKAERNDSGKTEKYLPLKPDRNPDPIIPNPGVNEPETLILPVSGDNKNNS